MIVIASMLVVFCLTAAVTIDFAYIQLVRTEMRSAADSAAKAGAEALARTEDIGAARAAAVHYASLNTVGGEPLRIRESDVHIGRLEFDPSNRWIFRPGHTPPNAVQVQARTGGSALHPAIPLFLSGIHGQFTISPGHASTAGQQSVEVVLCLDRSGSMLFDMSGIEFEYPPNNPLLMSTTQWNSIRNNYAQSQWPIWRNHLSPPHPTASRWAVLSDAIDLFLDEAGSHNPPPRTALVTWASNYTMISPPKTVFQAATTNVNLPNTDLAWSTNVTQVKNAVQQLGNVAMMGATNLSAGVDRAVSVLTGPNSAALASKVIILLTDGEWNEGRDPVEAAIEAREAGIIIHCVMMLTTDQQDIRQVAEITGGRYYVTHNEQQLRDAFQELARSLPVVLTQ